MGRDQEVSHLHFADDTICFLDANWDQLSKLPFLLRCFLVVSGLKINIAKISLATVDSVPLIDTWAANIGCKVEQILINYLGLPLGDSLRNQQLWAKIIERVDTKLAGWKKSCLSRGGRITLIKSTLTNISLYALSLFPILVGVSKLLVKKMRNFLWGKKYEERGNPLVSWDQICTRKEFGGLGVKDLVLMNKALLVKWLWRFIIEMDSLWRSIIHSKYGQLNSGWFSNIPRGTYGTSLWKGICLHSHIFKQRLRFSIENGESTYFWEDVWASDIPFNIVFPNLFMLSNNHNYTVKDSISVIDNSWNLHFGRRLRDHEIFEAMDLISLIGNPPLLTNDPDKMAWRITNDGKFIVRSLYDDINMNGEPFAPAKLIWYKKIPSKFCFHAWLVALNRVMTVDNIHKRDDQLVSRCIMCKKLCEMGPHLFIHCSVTASLWNDFLREFNLRWAMPGAMAELFLSWHFSELSPLGKILWRMLPFAIIHHMWKERNARIFNEKELTYERLSIHIKASIFNWCSILP